MKRVPIITMLILSSLFSSCEKWLDVKPDHEIFVDDVLINRQGFIKALDGIYKNLGNSDLYGRELKFGMLDVMAGYWIIDSGHDYYPIRQLNYGHSKFEKTRDAIWSKMYNAIHQCNVLLASIDNIHSDDSYNLIKGELLGLRGFIHLELFKLFGPVTAQKGFLSPAIPYYSANEKEALRPSNSRDVFLKIENDLLQAKYLLADDPIIKQGRVVDGNKEGEPYNALLDRRGIRMNYYAVMALLTRLAQWAGDKPKTIIRGEDLINELRISKAIRLITHADLAVETPLMDRSFSAENIWGLFVKDISKNTEGYFSGTLMSNTVLLPDFSYFLDEIYTQGSGSVDDYRYKLWGVKDFYTKISPYEYNSENSSFDRAHLFEIQMINLPEIYLILAESYLDENLQLALENLNILRYHRGLPELPPSTTQEMVKRYLMDEVRREYIGEGYLFTYYKRLFHPIYRNGGYIDAKESVFVLPLPQDELLFGPK